MTLKHCQVNLFAERGTPSISCRTQNQLKQESPPTEAHNCIVKLFSIHLHLISDTYYIHIVCRYLQYVVLTTRAHVRRKEVKLWICLKTKPLHHIEPVLHKLNVTCNHNSVIAQ